MDVKIKDICAEYEIDYEDFVKFIMENKLSFKTTITSYTIEDTHIKDYVLQYVNQYAEKQRIQAKNIENQKKQAEEKKIAKSKILISSGFNFEGYKIVKYSGYISGDDAIELPRSGTFNHQNNGQNLTDALVKIRRVALEELKEAAYNLGCNAVIGVDFDYMTLEPESFNRLGGYTTYEPYIVCVTANGNAVIIEKEKD